MTARQCTEGVNLTVQDLSRQDVRIQDLYLNISEKKLSITSLFSVQIMSYLGAIDIIHNDVIDSLISEILMYKSWILASWRKRSWTVRFTPFVHLIADTPSRDSAADDVMKTKGLRYG